MCGRYSITSERVEYILQRFKALSAPNLGEWKPRFNAAPGQMVPALVAKDSERYLTEVFWGILPPWGEKKEGASAYQANIRDDTAMRNAFFRGRLATHRCAFIVDGFYEWQRPPGFEDLERGARLPKGVRKIPHRIVRKDREPFPLAGLWRTITRDEEQVVSGAIITTGPNALMAPIHDRMPVILPDEALDSWLDPSVKDVEVLQSFLRPLADGELEAYPVSDIVNNSRLDAAACIEPLTM